MTKSKIYDNLLWITLTQVMIYTFNRCVGRSPSGPFGSDPFHVSNLGYSMLCKAKKHDADFQTYVVT